MSTETPLALAASLLRGLVDLFIPPACVSCGDPHRRADRRPLPCDVVTATSLDATLCASCQGLLRRLPVDACSLCQQAPSSTEPARHGGSRCHECESQRSALASCRAAVALEGEAERWIHRFKYPPRGLAGLAPAPGSVARGLIVEASRGNGRGPAACDWVIPIPLHPRRLRSRGFNPAALLAASVARASGARLTTHVLRRTRDTPTQTRLPRIERRRNVRGAFACDLTTQLPERVWLVDDVVTTGSTLEEAARCLRHHGARAVHALCAARALRE